MGTQPQDLHIVFLPFPAHGHMIPALDIARLFASRNNVKATIITTPLNAPNFTKPNENTKKTKGPIINIEIFRFPAQEVGLPEGIETPDLALGMVFIQKFFRATELLSEQLKQYLEKVRPNCIVADMFFPWTTESAAKFNIPRLVFHGTSNFALCAQELVRLHDPCKMVHSDDEPFRLPFLPHEIMMTKLQISEDLRGDEDSFFKRMIIRVKESEVKSYGVIVNSFYDLEQDYADLFRRDLGRRSWNIGPVSLCNRSIEDKAQRGKQASIDEHQCLKWLNSKNNNSVIYICFGSTSRSIAPQLNEIATALEASGQNFIWAIRNADKEQNEDWLPEGFEQCTKGKGLIIRGWAPQVLILEHEAIGAFVTHCGWNSTLEGITAGVPMVTWPMFAEQFYNEKLVTDILKIGIPVGVKKWSRTPLSMEDVIKKEDIVKVLGEIMEGNEVEERRIRAKKLKEMAMKAVEEGGSSYLELDELINELRGYSKVSQN